MSKQLLTPTLIDQVVETILSSMPGLDQVEPFQRFKLKEQLVNQCAMFLNVGAPLLRQRVIDECVDALADTHPDAATRLSTLTTD